MNYDTKKYLEEMMAKDQKDGLYQTPFEVFVREFTTELSELLIAKNKSYGSSVFDPVRIFSKADSIEQINVRIDDKLSRLKRGNGSFNEDTLKDLIGYLVIKVYAEKLK